MVVIMYIMNYLDRNNIAAARLAGMQEELNLSSTEYLVFLALLSYFLVAQTLIIESDSC